MAELPRIRTALTCSSINTKDIDMTTFEIATLTVSSIGLVLLVFQLWAISRTVKLDNERTKNQATVEVAAKEFRKARLLIQKHYGINKLTEDEFRSLISSKENMADVNEAFGIIEHISVALHANIYDKDLFFNMFGTTCMEIFDNYNLYIEYRRERHGAFTYNQFEQLVNEVAAKHKERSKN